MGGGKGNHSEKATGKIMYQILLLPHVINQISKAYNWYEEQRNGLGEELTYEIERCYEKLSEHPQHYSFTGKKYRRLRINRFPYLFIYKIVDDIVLISSFIHAKRKRKDK